MTCKLVAMGRFGHPYKPVLEVAKLLAKLIGVSSVLYTRVDKLLTWMWLQAYMSWFSVKNPNDMCMEGVF